MMRFLILLLLPCVVFGLKSNFCKDVKKGVRCCFKMDHSSTKVNVGKSTVTCTPKSKKIKKISTTATSNGYTFSMTLVVNSPKSKINKATLKASKPKTTTKAATTKATTTTSTKPTTTTTTKTTSTTTKSTSTTTTTQKSTTTTTTKKAATTTRATLPTKPVTSPTTTTMPPTTFKMGEWIVIQSRAQSGNPANFFAKSWVEYVEGFTSGDETWLGLDNIANYTSNGRWELSVEATTWNGKVLSASYGTFSLGSAPRYELTVGDYDYLSSNLGDGLKYHNGAAFSTMDMDQDDSRTNCASRFGEGGWWYHKCFRSNLNGLNLSKGPRSRVIQWINFKIKEVSMKIRNIGN